MATNEGYPDNWKAIAYQVKARANFTCEVCGHGHDSKSGFTLTVHHLDHDPANCQDWNLVACCQRCHLRLQQKSLQAVIMIAAQTSMFPVDLGWLKARLPEIEKALSSKV